LEVLARDDVVVVLGGTVEVVKVVSGHG
jgi:hypothetical protein